MTSEFSHKALDMRTASLDEAADLLRKIAGDRQADESMKAVFRRLRRRLSHWSDNRIRDVWRRDRRVRVRAEEVEQLRALVDQGATKEAARDDLEELRSRITRLERLLETTDSAFHSETLVALGNQRREMD